MKVNNLCSKVVSIIKEDGIVECVNRANAYIAIHHDKIKEKRENRIGKVCKDVLFINGHSLSYLTYYRVLHQMEQLSASNITNEQIFYSDITIDLVKKYRVFIFCQCSYTEEINEFIRLAKKWNKTILYDIDGIIIDYKFINQVDDIKIDHKEQQKEDNNSIKHIKKLLQLCDGAITTTERLAEELKKYVPIVYINRNVASEEMMKYSEKALYYRDILPYLRKEQLEKGITVEQFIDARRKCKERKNIVRLGYYSQDIFSSNDIKMILSVLENLLEKYAYIELHLIGKIKIPLKLKKYTNRIIFHSLIDEKKLPELLASIDINLVPMQKTIFNEIKPENKWIEAALVKVPTVASHIGAFEKMIEHGNTGFLCNSINEWYDILCKLIEKKELRKEIGERAYQYVKKYCTIYNTNGLRKFIRAIQKPNIIFILPSVQISGGILVILKHAIILQDAGYDVSLYNKQSEEDNLEKEDHIFPVLSLKETRFHMYIDKVVASFWNTCYIAQEMQKNNIIRDIYYLVQGFETDLYETGSIFKIKANATYYLESMVTYLTISKWCQNWLKNNYEQEARFALNGLDREKFYPVEREFKGKVRILIEGNSDDYYKNVDESFRIVEKLDKNKYEIWFMSYLGKPKKWYYFDKFLHQVPYEKVPSIYRKCDILIKSSILESFSYPPLEMMATGGYVIAVPNGGNQEYLKDRENVLFYQQGDIDNAVNAIEEIYSNAQLRKKLYINGINTADERNWKRIKKQILTLYE